MKYFKNLKDNDIYAFESDGSQDSYITSDFVELTAEEKELHLNPPVVVTTFDVDAERDRRMQRFQFKGVWFQSREIDRIRIAGAHSSALASIINSTPWPEDFSWIAEDDSRIPMTAQDVIEFGAAATLNERTYIFSGSNLKAISPIPLDYKDDQYWP